MLDGVSMPAQILDGKAIAAKVRSGVAAGVAQFRASSRGAPGLDVIFVGDDPSFAGVRTQQGTA